MRAFQGEKDPERKKREWVVNANDARLETKIFFAVVETSKRWTVSHK